MSSVVVFTPDVVGERMAGPGIRAYYFARELAKHFPTSLIADFQDFALHDESFTAIQRDTAEARWALLRGTVVVGQPVREILALPKRDRRLVLDLFDPTVLELRELYGDHPSVRQSVHYNREWARLRMALQNGDVLISATQRQRDFYSGVYCSFGRVREDWLRRWIDVPFGIDLDAPAGDGDSPLDPSRPWIIWGGGTWAWLDPVTAVDSVLRLNERGIDCRLLFLGGSRPNGAVGEATRNRALGKLIIRAGDVVVRNSEWVPYAQRGRWLHSARAAIMLHKQSLEAEFSIRTRVFDALWCSLPVVATEGGFAADLVRREGCGITVAPADVGAVEAALERLLTDNVFHATCVSNIDRIRSRFDWTSVTRPLIEAIKSWE